MYWYETLHVMLREKHNLQGLKTNYSGKYLGLRGKNDEWFRMLHNYNCFIPIDNLVLLGQ